jgi:colanic acid/amylovoran biosynthesis glycosyltransferase
MKVLHYCDAFSTLSQTFIYDVIVELDRIQVENIVVTGRIVNSVDRPYNNVIKLPVLWIDMAKKVFKKGLEQIGVLNFDWKEEAISLKRKGLLKVVRAQRPDIIHAHFGTHGSVVLPVAKELEVPLVVSFHGFDAFLLPNIAGWIEKLKDLFIGASLITVVSELMKHQLINLGCPPEKLQVIHVGKKISDYQFKEALNLPIKNFISIGRLAEKKGHEDTIKAFYELIKVYPSLHLKIIGEGELKEDLIRLIKSFNLEKHVTLLGSKSHSQTKEYLAAADAFILCSKTSSNGDMEGVPTVLMEAQCMGLPCITTRHSGIPEVIPVPNYWTLATEGDINSIVTTIHGLLNCPKDQLLKTIYAGRAKIESEFNLTIEVAKLKQLFNTLIEKVR